MLYEWIRLFKYDGSSIVDVSLDNQDSNATINAALGTTDYFYFAQYFPLNNFYVYIDTPNTNASSILLQFWDGKEWRNCVDVLDGTSVAGKSFARSGNIQFEPLRQYSWNRISETDKNYAPLELQSMFVYELYWLRLKFSSDLSAGTKVRLFGYAFTSGDKLKDIDIEIDTFFESFSSSKTDWNDQILTASRMVLADLKRLGLVMHQGQVLRFDQISMATDYKALELIYMNLGTSYNERKEEIRSLYQSQLNIKGFTFDLNDNAKVDTKEIAGSYFVGYR